MAKFKTNYEKQGSGFPGTATKFGLFAVVMGMLIFVFNKFSGGGENYEADHPFHQETPDSQNDNGKIPTSTIRDFTLPSSTTGNIVKHEYYALSYSEKDEEAEWVAYELTRDRLNQKRVQRANNFRPDPKVKTGSADIYDYKRSGYDRGHLVPAGDMAFSPRAMSETFYMSNISPQVRNFNGGIWRELEENVRDWARRFRHLYIVTGPVLTDDLETKIGKAGVTVPKRFYKVILDITEPELKGIGFIIPNELSTKTLDNYAVTIDEVEAITGIDFFAELMDDATEEELEGVAEPELWRYSLERYQQRIENWNKR